MSALRRAVLSIEEAKALQDHGPRVTHLAGGATDGKQLPADRSRL